MELSDAGLALIARFEGCRLDVYDDVAGHPTIGYGHLLRPGESFPDGITQAEALALLRQDAAVACAAVDRACTGVVAMTQGQYDALVDLAYNCGGGVLAPFAFLLHTGDSERAANLLLEYDHAGGQVVAGLLARRQAERAMFLGLT